MTPISTVPLKKWIVPTLIGLSTVFSGCGDNRSSVSPYQKQVQSVKDRLDQGIPMQQIPGSDLVCLYATYNPLQLQNLAQDQQQRFDQGTSLTLREVWALGNVLRVVAYNSGIDDPSAVPVSFETVIGNSADAIGKDNAYIRGLIAKNTEQAGAIAAIYQPYLPQQIVTGNPAAEANLLSVLIADLDRALNESDKDKIADAARKAALYLGYKDEAASTLKPTAILLEAAERQKAEQVGPKPILASSPPAEQKFQRQYLAGNLAEAVFQTASMQSGYSDIVFASAAARKSKESDDEAARVAAVNNMNTTIRNMQNSVQFQSSGNGK